MLVWEGDTLFTSDSFSMYRWYVNDSLVAETTSNFWVPGSSGVWRVEGFDPSGCSAESNSVEVTLSSLGDLGFEWSVFPNPFIDRFLVHGRVPDGHWLELLDIRGNSVRALKNDTGVDTAWDWVVDDLPVGVYLLVVRNGQGFFPIRRLVKSSKGS